jgi:serine/threonine-protein kinase RsbW
VRLRSARPQVRILPGALAGGAPATRANTYSRGLPEFGSRAHREGEAQKQPVTEQTPTVRLELDSRPESVTLVRGMLVGIGEELALEAELLDDVKTAVSEACNNVVMHAYGDDVGPMIVDFELGGDEIGVSVRDRGRGIRGVSASHDRMGVGLAVISALADRSEFVNVPEGGTEVRMSFAGRAMTSALERAEIQNGHDWPKHLDGDVVARISSARLLRGVLGRLARALAAQANFSVDRFSELYPVTDALAAHAEAAGSSHGIGFGIVARDRRIEVTIGKFRCGSSAGLKEETGTASPLKLLADELSVEMDGDSELLRVVVADTYGAERADTRQD